MLTIQVTGLSGDTGFAIGVLCHHAITDATSGISFLSNLASIARGAGLLFHPNSDRSVFKARHPPQPSFPHHEFIHHPNLDSSRYAITLESAICVGERSKRASGEIKRRKAFHFSFETLTHLKNSVLASVPRGCTTFEALAAYVWRYAARYSKKVPEETSRLRFVLDIRRTVQPPLDATFVGNAIYWAHAEMTQRDLVGEPLGAAVIEIQRARAQITDEYLRSGWDFLEENRDFWYSSGNCDVGINAWPRAMLGARELDFGWGKPCRAVFPLDPETSTVMFVPVDGGIDVSLCLFPHQLEQYSDFVPTFAKQ
ncbi:omega-hydroxypalmitate O-feruloyl transferase [Selaginella moellendorffii]|nr:omega-hydroxypalmitate O-feruloyl transferase [Selaginella moellendorffii]|eukprot:XP_002989824.2 omega-hydroxypalmitate O-feruloyl transferase [Selaginella moellendorffii]